MVDDGVLGELVEALVEEANRGDLASTRLAEEGSVDQPEAVVDLSGDLRGDPGRCDGVAEPRLDRATRYADALRDVIDRRRPCEKRLCDVDVERDGRVAQNLVL